MTGRRQNNALNSKTPSLFSSTSTSHTATGLTPPFLGTNKMSTNDANSHLDKVLRRIADGNRRVESGTGIGSDHLVPVCSITNRSLAATFKQRLIEEDVIVHSRRERLCTRFSVPREDMANALRIRETLLAEQSDSVPRKYSRDYDSVFLLTPFTILAAFITYATPWISNSLWIGVLTSGVTAMILLEHRNRHYRNYFGSQWGIQDLLWGTAAAAINIAVWQSVL